MKTKTFLLLCLFLGFGLTQLLAQNGKNGTGTITGYDVAAYDQPIYRDGTLIDRIIGTVEYHYVDHFTDGNFSWAKSVDLKSEGKSVYPPYEVFKLHEIDKSEWEVNCIKWHFNLIGNMGSHYVGIITWNFVTDETTFDKLIVPGGNK
jgi:hypothetical protein